MNKGYQYISLLALNGFIVAVLIFLQCLMFSFLPAIDPSTPTFEQRTVALNFVIRKSVPLIAELAIGVLISFAINKRLFKLSFKKNVWVLLIEFIIVVVSMIVFALGYINKFG